MNGHSAARISRRHFLKTAGATALVAGAGPAVIIPGRAQPKTLKILRVKEFTASANQWFVDFASAWGKQNDLQVVLDHATYDSIVPQVKAEFAAKQSHDLYQYVGSPAIYEEQVIDHREIVEESERRYGKALDMVTRSSFNPKTKKFFSILDGLYPLPVIYRHDLWNAVGRMPDTWDDIRLGGRHIKLLHGPTIGISLGGDTDSQGSLRALLYSFGGAVQDTDNRPALKSPATLEALKFAKALYEEAMSEEVTGWNNVSNNRVMLAGELSLALNQPSITRTAENKQMALNKHLWIAAAPAGPADRLAPISGDSG